MSSESSDANTEEDWCVLSSTNTNDEGEAVNENSNEEPKIEHESSVKDSQNEPCLSTKVEQQAGGVAPASEVGGTLHVSADGTDGPSLVSLGIVGNPIILDGDGETCEDQSSGTAVNANIPEKEKSEILNEAYYSSRVACEGETLSTFIYSKQPATISKERGDKDGISDKNEESEHVLRDVSKDKRKPVGVMRMDEDSLSNMDISMSDVDSTSSSDVDVIDESIPPDLENPCFVHNPLDFSFVATSPVSQPNRVLLGISTSFTSSKDAKAVAEEGTQTDVLPVRKFVLPQCPPLTRGTVISGLLTAFTFLSISLAVLVTCLFHIDSHYVAMELKSIHHSIAICLDKQQDNEGTLDVIRNLTVCKDKNADYLPLIKPHLTTEVISYLLKTQKRFSAGENVDAFGSYEDMKNVDVRLIICQLEYYKVLPQMIYDESVVEVDEKRTGKRISTEQVEEDLVAQMREAIENLTVVNKQLQSQIITKLASNKVITAEVNAGNDPTKTKAQKSESCSVAIKELQEKINQLLLENKILKYEISIISCGNGECSSTKSSFAKASDADNVESPNSEGFGIIASLTKQIESLRGSLSDELSEVKKWNALIENITSNLKSQFSSKDDEGNDWSWQELKSKVENVILEAQKDISSTISSFQIANVSDIVQEYVEGNKKQVESALNFFDHYFKLAREKTREFFGKKVPEDKAENNVEGDKIKETKKTWNIWGRVKSHWSAVKGEIKEMLSKFRRARKSLKEETSKEHTRTNQHPKMNREEHDIHVSREKKRQDKNNWLFRRAADREKLRQTTNKAPDNWYMRRLKLHEKGRKRNGRDEL